VPDRPGAGEIAGRNRCVDLATGWFGNRAEVPLARTRSVVPERSMRRQAMGSRSCRNTDVYVSVFATSASER
jgi:hypothetical protein